MDQILEFLKTNPTYFLATVDAQGNPQLRPFGTIARFDGGLYIQTGRSKAVYQQIKDHSRVAISGMGEGGTWIRIECDLIEDARLEAETAVMDDYPNLQGMYQAGDGNCCVFRMENISAYIDSFTAPRQVLV